MTMMLFEGRADQVQEPEIEWGRLVIYQYISPVLIVLNVITSMASIVVLRRPALRSLQANRYFQMLMWCDLAFSLSVIPLAVHGGECSFSSYWGAWLHAHAGWTVPNALHFLSAYILTWLALDRCLAVWYHPGYTFMQKPRVQNLRAIFTAALCFLMTIPFMMTGEVLCTSLNGTEISIEHDPDCNGGVLSIANGYQNNFNQLWYKILIGINVCVMWLCPGVLLAAFNFSLVAAVLLGRVRSYARSSPGQKGTLAKTWERNLVITMIAMATSFLILVLPIIVYLLVYAKRTANECYEYKPHITFSIIAVVLLVVEHLLHSVFLVCLIPSYRKELCIMLRLDELQSQPPTIPVTSETPL